MSFAAVRTAPPGTSLGTSRLAPEIPLQVAVRVAAQTRPQSHPRETSQQTFPVISAEALPIGIRVTCRVIVEFRAGIGVRDTVHFALGFAPQDPPRFATRVTVRTTPRTVPGTVPTVVPGMSTYATSNASNELQFGYLDWSSIAQPHQLPLRACPVGPVFCLTSLCSQPRRPG